MIGAGVAVAVVLAFGLGWVVARRKAARDYRQIAGLLLGLRDGEYALRAVAARGARGEAFGAVNALADGMMGARRAGIESDALLGKLLGAVELAVIVVGPRGTLVGGNEAAGALLGVDAELLGGEAPERFGIAEWLTIEAPTRFETVLAGGAGPWEVRRVRFRRGARDHVLLVVSDLSGALRAEERRVWRGLIRVLSHETGNSLGPIQATAEALQRRLHENGQRRLQDDGQRRLQEDQQRRLPDGDEVLRDGLALIERRTRSLAGFIRRYAELARLPPPVLEPVRLDALLGRVVALETRVAVDFEAAGEVQVQADTAQLEQALINLVRNAAEASLETGGLVAVTLGADCRITICDEGLGLPRSENLFVPGFTTKPGGSGIGLVLAREIIEAHGGRLAIGNRGDRTGAFVIVTLPAETSAE